MNTPKALSSQPSQNFSQVKCSPSTLICREKTTILGDVTIGPDCIIHPTVSIIAKNGPIIIGSSNLIEERVSIINNRSEPMRIGNNNIFEVDSYSEAPRIGNHNTMESKSRVGANVELTDSCIIGAGCEIANREQMEGDHMNIFPPHTVVSGKDLNRRVVMDLPANSLSSQLDFLRKILPNYQKLWRPLNLGTPQQQQQQHK